MMRGEKSGFSAWCELEAAAGQRFSRFVGLGVLMAAMAVSIPEDAIILADSTAVRCWEEFHVTIPMKPR